MSTFTPRKDEKLKQLTINLSEDELKRIEEIAERIGTKRSNIIRQMVQFALRNQRRES